MKTLRIFIWKEIRHVLRDTRTLLILIVLPVVLVLLFGFVISNDIQQAGFVVMDPEAKPASQRLVRQMEATGYFKLGAWVQSRDEVEQAFKQSGAKIALVIPPDFIQEVYRQEGQQIQFIADSSDPNTATNLINYASAVVRQFMRQELLSPQSAPPMQITTEIRMLYNPLLKSVHMFVPGVLTLILTLVSALMTSISLTREKENGNMELLLVSPLRPTTIIIGKVIPYLILGLTIILVTLVMSATVFQMPVRGNIILLGMECALYILTCLSLGVLVSTRVETQQVAMLISMMALMLPVMLLSGFIFPVESMPIVLQWVSHIIPAKWFIKILKSIMLKGNGLDNVWWETSILLAMTLFLLIASIRNFKIRLA